MSDRICVIVDDEPCVRTYLQTILEREQLTCLEADSPGQALRILRELKGCVDLVVSDIIMPGDMDGVDLAASIRHCFPAIPVILISGYAEEDIPKRLDGLVLIHKPFLPDTFLMVVRKIMEPQGSPRESTS